MATSALPDLIAEAQTTEEEFLHQIFVRDQMAEWSKHPLVMERADGVFYWDTTGKRFAVTPGTVTVQIGASSADVRANMSLTVAP